MSSNQSNEPGSRSTHLGPIEIQQKEFRVSRFGGYKMRDVDEFLDELTTVMTELTAERDRLRSQANAAPVVGSPDLDDVGRQADEIIQRARDEAAQIVADARAGAVATGAIAAGTASDRGAVEAFLLQEREFLQGLGALVQGHAESVKRMAKAARSAAPARAEAMPARAEIGAAETMSEETELAEVEPVEPSPPIDAPAPDAASPTIRLQEPQPAAAADADADGSLRELFWGEED